MAESLNCPQYFMSEMNEYIAHTVHQLDQPLVALGDRAAQLVAVDVDIVKESAEIRLAVAALGGVLDRLKDRFQRLVQILVQRRAAADAAKQLARQDEKVTCIGRGMCYTGFTAQAIGGAAHALRLAEAI